MMLRSLGTFLALAAAIFLGVACGGGDNAKSSATPTNASVSGASSTVSDQALKDYFQQLSTILTGVDAQMTQLKNQYPSAGSDPDQTRQFLSQFLSVSTTALNDVKNLNPPSTVKALHDKFVSALGDVVMAETSLSDDVQSINTAADITAYFDSHKTDFKAKTDAADSVCSELEAQAKSANLSVDLPCGSASSPAATRAAATPVH